MVTDNKRRSICLYCALGCGTSFRTDGEHITAIDYDKEDPVNKGALCPRGYYNLELIKHPQRLTHPYIGKTKASWKEAISRIHDQRQKYSPEQLGISISAAASNEDALLVGEAANQLGIKHVKVSGAQSDNEAYEGSKWEAPVLNYARPENIGNVDALLIVGDILTRSPVLSKYINKVKYGKRGNQIIVIDPNVSHTSWFATTHIRLKPGTEAVLAAGILKVIAEENKKYKAEIDLQKVSEITGVPVAIIEKAAKAFDDAESGTVIFAPSSLIKRNDLVEYFIRHIAASSLNKDHITFYGFGNALGVNRMLDHVVKDRSDDIGSIKSLFAFGPVTAPASLELLVYCGYFMPERIPANSIVLPQACHMERKGSVLLAGGRSVHYKPIEHKVGGKTPIEIVSLMMEKKNLYSDAIKRTNELLAKEPAPIKAELDDMLNVSMQISAGAPYEPRNITHFGNNEQVKRFFWYRVNN